MIFRLIFPTCGSRLFEWVMAVAFLSLGLHLMVWPDSVAFSGFRLILRVVNAESLSVFYFLIGVFRAVALLANGAWPLWGPRIRAFGALGGAVLWVQMYYALIMLSPHVGTPPTPTIELILPLILGEVFSCYRVWLGEEIDARYR